MRATRAVAEALTERLERSPTLASWGRTVTRVVSRWLRPGRTKDLLAGTWLAHPVHPMLTDVTIGAWMGASVLDLLGGEGTERAANAVVGVGMASAIPTVATGLSDLADVTTPEERAAGTAHALGNTAALCLYAASLVARRRRRGGVAAALSGLGLAAMTGAGFLGGHLAYRRGVGVDQTAFHPPIREWTAALPDDELPGGEPRRVTVSGINILLVRSAGTIRALANRCSHRGGPLHKGRLQDGGVACPWHGSVFALDDGSVVRGPATAPQPNYEVRVVDGTIEVRSG